MYDDDDDDVHLFHMIYKYLAAILKRKETLEHIKKYQ